MTWGPADEAKHPRDPHTGEWVEAVSARLPGHIYYHGTVAEDLEEVLPASTHRRGVAFPNDTDPDYAYASPSERNAWHYAELAWNNSDRGVPRVYRVRATGPIEDDPYYPGGVSRGNFSDDVRSRHPFEVLDELPTPEHYREGFGEESIFDTLSDPEFGNASPQQQEAAEQWAHSSFDYPDRTSGTRSEVSGVEHNVDGFSVNGRFHEGNRTVGTWSVGVMKNGGDDGMTPSFDVEEINLDPDWQRQGVAGRWVKKLEQAARDSGARQITMWDMSGGFWEHHGYVRDRRGIGRKQL